MLRYKPLNPNNNGTGKPSCAAHYLRTVAGDELNVCINYNRLGGDRSATLVSSLPASPHPHADLIRSALAAVAVGTSHIYSVDAAHCGEVGSFTMLPQEKRVHYRRSSSTFWIQQPQSFDWKHIYQGSTDHNGAWLHATGITPLCGPQACKHWCEHLQIAAALSVPVSMDFNHRPALGSIEQLWEIVQPQLQMLGEHLKFIVFSLTSLRLLSKLLQVQNVPEPSAFELTGAPSESNDLMHPCWGQLLLAFRQKLIDNTVLHANVGVAVCFKRRTDAQGSQSRWSAVATRSGLHSTAEIPTHHRPKDECGGGSAWSTGCIDGLIRCPTAHWRGLLRRGDVSAAWSQEIVGDQSNTSGIAIDQCLTAYANRPAFIGVSSFLSKMTTTATGTTGTTRTTRTAAEKMNSTIVKMGQGRCIAILRAKNADLAIARGIELVNEMGATCIEVTTDTDDFRRVLSTLSTVVGHKALVGVGTVMHASDVQELADLGATFALSPVNPLGFVTECLRVGIVPVPAAFTPTEIWTAYQQGAQVVKLFPAHLWETKVLKAMLGTGPLGNIKIVPSGGISPETALGWLEAGAFAVGMGSNLTGKDVKIDKGCELYGEKIKDATEHWNGVGRNAAEQCISALKKC